MVFKIRRLEIIVGNIFFKNIKNFLLASDNFQHLCSPISDLKVDIKG